MPDPSSRPILDVQDLSKTFTLHLLGGKRVRALEPFSFAVPEGVFLAVIGRSGSGKSTLLKCLYRTYLPSGGRALLRTRAGETIDLASAADETMVGLRGPELGLVSQFLRPTPRLSATDLVAGPLLRRGIARAEARERAAGLLRRLDLPADLLDGFPVLFSGGEQQRVNVARALIEPPRLLLLDEPTSALDAASQAGVVSMLTEARAAGTTVVGIFHDLDLVRRLADGYLHFRDGRLVAAGTAVELRAEAVA